MKCEYCRFAPSVNEEGLQDDCPRFEEFGTVWKDGHEGCTCSFSSLLSMERKHNKQLAEEAAEWGLEQDFRNHGWDLDTTIKHCKHMIGFDSHIPPKVYHRKGKTFYYAYRNYWSNGKKPKEDFEHMCHKAFGYMEKEVSEDGWHTYFLTDAGFKWLGRKIGVFIRKPK